MVDKVQGLPDGFWFPGRWLGGASLVLAPLLLLTGVLLRIQFHFFFPQQLVAYQQHPALMTASYSFFLAGNIALWPAVATVARLIGSTRPGWAAWGGSLVLFGLFARTFHAGVDHMAFQMVERQGLETASKAIAGTYGAFHIVHALSAPILFGWIVLAIGAYLSGTLGVFRAVALGLTSALMIGVLKGSSVMSVVSVSGLCIALVPLGCRVLFAHPVPPLRKFALWCLFAAGFIAALYYFGQLG